MNSVNSVIAFIQARMSSSRLPGKVLKTVMNKPLLLWQIERLSKAAILDEIVVATSDSFEDDPIFELCQQNGVSCFRGSLNDVLGRIYFAAQRHNATTAVRLTGDCPLLDYRIVDRVVREHFTYGADVTSNSKKPIYPDGMDVEVCSFEALERAYSSASKLSEREHVTLFFYNHPEQFFVRHCKALKENLSHLRLTVDEAEDFEKVRLIIEALAPVNPFFSLEDILEFLRQHPEVESLNARISRNEGLELSLQKERELERQGKKE